MVYFPESVAKGTDKYSNHYPFHNIEVNGIEKAVKKCIRV